MKTAYQSDEKPLDIIGFSLTALLHMHYAYSDFDTIKLSFLNKMPIFKNRAYFSVTSLALNDVNVKGVM